MAVCLSVCLSVCFACACRGCVPWHWLVCVSVDTKNKRKESSFTVKNAWTHQCIACTSVCLLQTRMDSVCIMSWEAAELAVCIAYATPGLLYRPVSQSINLHTSQP